MKQKQKQFTKEALYKAKDVKHTYSETFVEPMNPCAKPEKVAKKEK